MHQYRRVSEQERNHIAYRSTPARMRMLAGNMKTGLSLDFPVVVCQPTRLCAARCYAIFGQQSFSNALRRRSWAYRHAVESPDEAVSMVCTEMIRAGTRDLRLFGSGDWTADLAPFFERLAHAFRVLRFNGWGFSKKPKGYTALRKLGFAVLFSIDRTTDSQRLVFAKNVGWNNCAAVAMPEDHNSVWDRVRVVFPDHKLRHRVKPRANDCPAVRHEGNCGVDCRRCFTV